MSRRLRLVVASLNPAKRREIAEILAAERLDAEVLGLADSFPGLALPPETGSTFVENALLKAAIGRRPEIGLPAIADDSGLEVDALDGEPGIFSARYPHPDASDEERCAAILERLRGVPPERRTARFRCAAVFVTPEGETLLAEGICEGAIAERPAGSGGFGYDPIFVPQGCETTMAQLTPEQKHTVSHRGRAFRALAKKIREWAAARGG